MTLIEILEEKEQNSKGKLFDEEPSNDKLPKKAESEIAFTFKISQICNVTYVSSSYILMVSFILNPILMGTKELPYLAYIPFGGASPFYEIFFFTQSTIVWSAIHVVTGFDILFGAICAHVVAKFKILNYRLENCNYLGFDCLEKRMEIRECILEHKKILECVIFF